MILIQIKFKFEIDINNDGLLKIIHWNIRRRFFFDDHRL
jgi:hypothetical protein